MAYKRNNDRVVGKIIIQAKLENITPLTIGRGEGETSDHEVMRLPDKTPYIPASSVAGVLRQLMVELQLTTDQNYLWGRNGRMVEEPIQSHVRFEDLLPEDSSEQDISRRDGVKIDHQTGTAEDKKKYDYQLVEPGQVFALLAEITIRKDMDFAEVETFVKNLKRVLHDRSFRLGAFTNTGFGKFKCTGFHAYHFEFPKAPGEPTTGTEHWFNYLQSGEIESPEIALDDPQQINRKGSFRIAAWFSLKSSMMIGAYGTSGNEPDKSHLTSNGKPVLPGKSIRGAIRHRAVRIMNLIAPENGGTLVNDLFGVVVEGGPGTPVKKKGRLRVEESFFSKPKGDGSGKMVDTVTPMEQDRIRIDRFTGGTMDGALFNSEPVWTKGKQEAVCISLHILKKATPEEKNLLLLLLKDLWLEDLAIGGEKNVGRGILKGQRAEIYNDGDLVAAFKRVGEESSELEFTTGDTETINQLIKIEQSPA